jgi:hypothetical protein
MGAQARRPRVGSADSGIGVGHGPAGQQPGSLHGRGHGGPSSPPPSSPPGDAGLFS